MDAANYTAVCEQALGYDRAHEANPDQSHDLGKAWEASAAGGTDIPQSCSDDESARKCGVKAEKISPRQRFDQEAADVGDTGCRSRLLFSISPEKGCGKRKALGEITDVTKNMSSFSTIATPTSPQTATAKRPRVSLGLKRSKILSVRRTCWLSKSLGPSPKPLSLPFLDGLNLLLPCRSNVAPPNQDRPSEKLMGRALCMSLDELLIASGWVVHARAPGQVFQAGVILVNAADVCQVRRYKTLLATRRPADGCGAIISLVDIASLYAEDAEVDDEDVHGCAPMVSLTMA